jgi:hypothetical protein
MEILTIETDKDGLDQLNQALNEYPTIRTHISEIQAQSGEQSLWSIVLDAAKPLPANIISVLKRLVRTDKIGLIKYKDYQFREITTNELELVISALERLDEHG